MTGPKKIFVPVVFSKEYGTPIPEKQWEAMPYVSDGNVIENADYISEEWLREQLHDMLGKTSFSQGYMIAIHEILDKINSL